MGLFKKFSAPKAKTELKLNEVAYEYADKLTGKHKDRGDSKNRRQLWHVIKD